MKKLLSSLAAKAVAMILLVVMLLVATVSVVGTVVLVGDNGYLDNGKSLRQSLLSTVVYQAARDLEPLMDMLGQNDTQWIGYDTIVSYYEQEYDAAASNLCIRITDEDGKTLFQNRICGFHPRDGICAGLERQDRRDLHAVHAHLRQRRGDVPNLRLLPRSHYQL